MTAKELREMLDNTIENNDFYSRSFTYGVALEKLLKNNAFYNDEMGETIDTLLIQHVSSTLDIEEEKVENHFSLGAMVEFTDLSVLDEIARELSEVEL